MVDVCIDVIGLIYLCIFFLFSLSLLWEGDNEVWRVKDMQDSWERQDRRVPIFGEGAREQSLS